MLYEFLKNKELNSIINKFYKTYKKEVLDIILFGSIIRGKEKPNDIDILILFKNKENLDIAYELKKNLEKFNVEITTKTYTNLFDKHFLAKESFLGEGYSLIRREFISNGFGYSNIVLFKYELKGFLQTKRMQLQYALYGRDKKFGIVKKLKLIKFADTVFFCPIEHVEELKEFFNEWGIKFKSFPTLIPERIL